MKIYTIAAAVTVVAVAGITAYGAAFAAIYFGSIIGALSFAQPNTLFFKESAVLGAIFGAALGAFFVFALPAPTGIAVINGQFAPVFPIK